MKHLGNVNVLIYSHDTFGLGHLRRCRAIAHALVANFKGVRVLFITGSQVAGLFNFSARVDFVKIPSVIKLYNGEYTSIDRHIDLTETLAMRQSIIRHTAQSFRPDIMIVDKEPLGLRGELLPTLCELHERGCRLVLGLRDVMDAPDKLKAEWDRSDVLQHVDSLYDDIWVYGPEAFYDPLAGLDVPAKVRRRMKFVGFLERFRTAAPAAVRRPQGNYLIATSGGGGDGTRLTEQVLAAYRTAHPGLMPLLLVLGPLMPSVRRAGFFEQARELDNVEAIEFDGSIENLIADASAVVGMGGYNTFCEVLSFDRPALVMPRTSPRQEQLIRARRAKELGLVDMMLPDEADDPAALTQRLLRLPSQPRPHERGAGEMLTGLPSICASVERWAQSRRGRDLRAITGTG